MKLTGYEKPLKNYTREELIRIAELYKIYYRTPSGEGKMGGYRNLSKEQLISIIADDRDYKNKDPKRSGNRLQLFKESLTGIEKPEELMDDILSLISDTQRAFPIPGNYYTYIYYAKTPKLRYDRHPLIKAGTILPKGFLGFNYHWGKIRQYNTADGDRLVSGLYEVNQKEFQTLKSIPYRKIIQNF